MEAYLLLLMGVVAGVSLVMVFYPQIAFRPVDQDVSPEALGHMRWFMLGWFFFALGQGVPLAARMAGSAGSGLTAMFVLLAAGIGSTAWGLRGLRHLKQERLRLMRERHAAELAEIKAKQDPWLG